MKHLLALGIVLASWLVIPGVSWSQVDCAKLQENGEGYFHQNDYVDAYDTLRAFIEHCANENQIQPWQEFFTLGNSVANIFYHNKDSAQWEDFREWLKSVLYLNTTEFHYYCSDVAEIFQSMEYFRGRGTDFNGALAILKYVIDSGKCPREFFSDSLWANTRRQQYQNWSDTVSDSLKTPIDTTLPSLETLHLEILRGNNAGAIPGPSTIDRQSVTALSARPNPATDESEIDFNLRSVAAVRLEVWDLLGHQVFSDPLGFQSEGDHSVRLNTSQWAAGTYYVRLTSLTGGVMTVKLVKQ